MELDDSDSDVEREQDAGSPPQPTRSKTQQLKEIDTLDCFQVLMTDLQLVHTVLDKERKLSSSSRRSKDLVLVGLQDELT